ncbi:MAG: inositol monophosphatase family protein [Betaproteobacteria bacterium]|jgi:Archaeal fructose-1,6-bisphosphatase and related enzymes of inositol monophosphatase family|nr:inositol monophosphatase family protein [Betaproteobacteria bacterium]
MRLALIKAVERVAATEILPRYQFVTHERKADGSLLTEADIATQRALARALHDIHPVPLLGEEMDEDEQQYLWQTHDTLWCADPIDGTSNFVHGIPYFAVSVALIRHGRPQLGVVHDPLHRETFSAMSGKGAWFNEQQLHCRNEPTIDLHHAMASVDFKRLNKSLAQALVLEPPYASQRNFGACTLEWCHVAAGRCAVLLHGGQKLWDYAAGSLILEEAGGFYQSLEGIPYWKGNPWKRSVVAATQPALFQTWLDWLIHSSEVNSRAPA